MAANLADLAKPLDPKKVSWRIGQITKKDPSKASALCYIDARDVMERLDAVCGPGGWQDEYHETARGRVICTLRIKVGDEWVAKSDGAGDTAVEGEKGGISDAFKRAAVKWGVGRYLYDIPIQYVRINQYKQIEPSEYAKLEKALPGSKVAPTEPEGDMPISAAAVAALEHEAEEGLAGVSDLGDLDALWRRLQSRIKQSKDIDPAGYQRIVAGFSRRKSVIQSEAA